MCCQRLLSWWVLWCVSVWCPSTGSTGSFLVWMSAAALLYKLTLAQWLMWAAAASSMGAVISLLAAKRVHQLWKPDQWLKLWKHPLFPGRSFVKAWHFQDEVYICAPTSKLTAVTNISIFQMYMWTVILLSHNLYLTPPHKWYIFKAEFNNAPLKQRDFGY